MGLISAILTAPQLALDQLQLDRELGRIDDEEADRREDELLERLIEANRGGYPHG
jgi:hypothetical protein